jgi:hypothetical protein
VEQLYFFLISSLDTGVWSTAHPIRFTPRKGPPISIEWEDGWTPEAVDVFGAQKNLFPLPGIELQIVQPDYTIPNPHHFNGNFNAVLPCMLNLVVIFFQGFHLKFI